MTKYSESRDIIQQIARMLGDQISEEKGKMSSQRVLDVEGGMPKVETSSSATPDYRGAETTAT
jgi:hypothetical protein